MKWLYGWLTIGHWKLLKPFTVTLSNSKVGGDHEPVSKVRVGVGLGPGLGLALGLGPEPALEVNLGIGQVPIAKATTMVTCKAYVLGSPEGPPPQRRVSFHDPPNMKDPVKEEASSWMEPSVDDLETWLEFQAGQLGTPMWWEELAAVPDIEDRHKFARKIRASFYVPDICLRVSPEQVYTAPPAP